MILTRSNSWNCKMTFIIGRGFAERQILKKWKWPYLLKWLEYFDKLLRKHWYWQDLAHEIANWQFLSVEALPSSKFWKSENGPISRTVKNIVMKAYTLILTRCSQWDCQMIFGIGRSFFCRGSNSEKSETGPIPWTFWYILINLCIPITADML